LALEETTIALAVKGSQGKITIACQGNNYYLGGSEHFFWRQPASKESYLLGSWNVFLFFGK